MNRRRLRRFNTEEEEQQFFLGMINGQRIMMVLLDPPTRRVYRRAAELNREERLRRDTLRSTGLPREVCDQISGFAYISISRNVFGVGPQLETDRIPWTPGIDDPVVYNTVEALGLLASE